MTGPTTITVPKAVQRTAADALDLHRSTPLPAEQEASGVAVAERIVSGTVTAEDIASLVRFFSVNADHYSRCIQECRSARTSGLCRSWMLRGGDHARVWAEKTNARLVREGVLPADPYAELLRAKPDEIYARFAAGAWRWEYGLETPQVAAKFYEDYQRATGRILDLNAAFGPSGPAVSRAVIRRVYGPNPFDIAKRALKFEDAEYRLAATLDLQDLQREHGLDENIKPFILTGDAKYAAKIAWPAFVAYMILVGEKPDLLEELHSSTRKPPTLNQDPGSLVLYSDAVRIYLTYFHPKGAKYVSSAGTDFEGIEAEIEDVMLRAYHGKFVPVLKLQKLLGKARRWTAENKLAGSLFHVFNADWKKGNWPHILNAIPKDADVREPFTKFATLAPVPAAGIKLQQTLNDKKLLASIATFLDTTPANLDQQKIGATQFAERAEQMGTPVGTYALLKVGISERVLLGSFRDDTGAWSLVLWNEKTDQFSKVTADFAFQALVNGSWSVLKSHKDLSIVVAANASTTPKADATVAHDLGHEPAVKKDAATDTNIDTKDATATLKTEEPPQSSAIATNQNLGYGQPIPSADQPVPPPDPFAFNAGDVLKLSNGKNVYVESVDYGNVKYAELSLDSFDYVYPGFAKSTSKVFDKAEHLGNFSLKSLSAFVQLPEKIQDGSSTWTDFMVYHTSDSLSIGDSAFGGVVIAMFTATDKKDGGGALGKFAVTYDNGRVGLDKVKNVVTPTYAPTEPTPEAGPIDEELSGTPAAFDLVAQKGWTPAVQSESMLFKLELGGVYQYGAQTRTIIGYAMSGVSAVYLIRTDKGKVNWKAAVNGNKDYTPFLHTDPQTVSQLQPKPSSAPTTPKVAKVEAQFPKLNYRLTKEAKKLAIAQNLLYQPAPKLSPFVVGSKLLNQDGAVVRLTAWVNVNGAPHAVISQDGDVLNWKPYALSEVIGNLSVYYENSTFVGGNGVVFGKGTKNDVVTLMSSFDKDNPVSLPSDMPESWDSPDPIDEPPIPTPKEGKHVACGILAVFPAGVSLVSPETKTFTENATVVLCYPAGQYGGYKLTIPKGTVDAGESPIVTATREFYEETGMSAKPVAYLGDFRATTSTVRLYVGYVTGGNPQAQAPKGKEETDAVALKGLTDVNNNGFQNDPWWNDLIPESGSHWQQNALLALSEWLVKNGVPQSYVPPTAAPITHSQVTTNYDASASPNGLMIPLDDVDAWKALLFKSPFPVTTAMVTALKKKVSSGVASEPVSFDCAKTRSTGPAFGQVFETQEGTPYTASGYVSWHGQDGSYYHYLLALSGAGLVEPLPCNADGAPGLTVSQTDTESSKSKAPQFTHPDPATMARIELIWKAGGDLKAGKVNMQTFKLKWLKEAGVPYYAVASTNILQELSGLFVAGALSESQADAVLACLKARMASTQTGKKTKASATPVAKNALVAPAGSDPVAPVVKSKPVPVVTFITPSAAATVQYPQNVALTPITANTITASSKPVAFVQNSQGDKFMVKWRPGEPFQAEVDATAAMLTSMVKSNVVPVGVLDYNGQRSSIQPFFDKATPSPSSPDTLSDANKAELLAQHAVDMFFGDHDGHGGNWIMVGERLVPIDRGQSFKFLLQGKPDSFDPSWSAPGNFGEGYAKKLLKLWATQKATIPASAWAAMLGVIESIQSKLTDEVLETNLATVIDAKKLSAAAEKKFFNVLRLRRDSYKDAWTVLLKGLRKDFAWPTADKGFAIETIPLTSTPADLKFTTQEEETIKQAVAAGWQGKSLRIDGPWIENQEVMVRAVMLEQKQGAKVPATLVHFRLSKNGGITAQTAFAGSGVLETTEGAGGPQRLVADKSNGIYEKLFAAIKTINFHLNKTPDGNPNQTTVQAALSMRPILEEMLAATKSAGGTYGPAKEPNEAVNAMADQYLGYLNTIEYWNKEAANLIGQHSPTFTEFVYEEPPEEKSKKPKPTKTFKAKLKNQGASYPTITTENGVMVVKNLHKPVVNSSQVAQFEIEDPTSGGKLFFNPTTGQGGVKAGVQGVKGICWGVIPGSPSAPVVAHLLKLFGEATGLSMAKATPEDRKALYLFKQAAALQGGGSFKPAADGTALVDPVLTKAMTDYEQGKSPAAIEALTTFVAKQTGMTTTQVATTTATDADGYYDVRDAGFLRHNRIGWDRDRIVKALGANVYVTHALLGHSGAEATFRFLQDASINGALLANEVKPFYGVVKDGASPSSDFAHGGSQGIFCCFRKAVGSFHVRHLYFDLSLALRLDVYIVGSGDSFGDVHSQRYTMPEQWAKNSIGSGAVGASSSHQILVRHDLDLRTYLAKAKCGSKDEADKCIALVKKLGWQFQFGPPEKIFIY